MRFLILLSLFIVLFAFNTQANYLDNILKKGKSAVEEMVNKNVKGKPSTPEKESGSKPTSGKKESTATGSEPKKDVASTDYRSVSFIMKRWPYEGNNGQHVRNATIRGIGLGMPLPQAVRILESNNFSYVNGNQYQQIHYLENGKRKIASRKAYYDITGNQRGAIVRSITIFLTTAEPSPELLKELPAYPEDSGSSGNSKYQAAAKNMSDAQRSKAKSRVDRLSRSSSKKVKKQYITGITFKQLSTSEENVDGNALIDAARNHYGKPSYTISQTQPIAAKGAAFGRNSGGLWYCDCALESKQTIETLLAKSGLDDRTMVFDDLIHPGNASNAYYIRAYDSMADRVAALRIARAPYMQIGFKGAAFTVNLQWPFLKAEREYRELWAKQQAQKKKPAADVEF